MNFPSIENRIKAMCSALRTAAGVCRRGGREEGGQALVEMAYVAPVLLGLTLGMFLFGTAVNQYLVLNNAVEVGGQYLADLRGYTTTDPCTATVTAIENAAPNLSTSNLTITFSLNGGAFAAAPCGTTDMVSGYNATVKATYPISYYIPWFGTESVTLTAQVEEVIQ